MGVRVGESRRGRRHLELCRGPKVCCLFKLTCLCLALFLFLSPSLLPHPPPALLYTALSLSVPLFDFICPLSFHLAVRENPSLSCLSYLTYDKEKKKMKTMARIFLSLSVSLYLWFLLELCAVSWHDLELF